MESYFNKLENLKSGERSMSVSRASSPQPLKKESSESKVDNNQNSSQRVVRKVVYKDDLNELVLNVEKLKNQLKAIEEDNREKHNVVVEQLQSLKKDISLGDQQSKTERLKEKLESFINKYNENMVYNSDVIKNLDTKINELNNRLQSVEEII